MEEKRLTPDALFEQIKQGEDARKPEGLPYGAKGMQDKFRIALHSVLKERTVNSILRFASG
jgi:hypothetical protein